MTNSPINQTNNSGIQQVIDLNKDGNLPTEIKVDFLIDTVRCMRTLLVICIILFSLLLTGTLAYIIYSNNHTQDVVLNTVDTINKRHFLVSRALSEIEKLRVE